MINKLKLDQIETEGLQARVGTYDQTVADYAERMEAGVKFPPVISFHDGARFHLGDGMHRYLAAKRIGAHTIDSEVRKGTHDDALWFAAGTNQTHGLRRNNDDKRKSVQISLKLKPTLSDRAIAEHCGVNNHLVAEIRKQLGELPVEGERVGADGKKRKYPPPPAISFKPKDQDPPRVQAGPPKVVDGIGREIPADLVPLWERREEVSTYLHAISKVRTHLRDHQEDQLYAEVNHTSVLAALDNAYSGLKLALPFTVCPTCQGKVTAQCRLCKQRGFISEFRWERTIPKETKDIILKTIKP